jgi:hypothetical protein
VSPRAPAAAASTPASAARREASKSSESKSSPPAAAAPASRELAPGTATAPLAGPSRGSQAGGAAGGERANGNGTNGSNGAKEGAAKNAGSASTAYVPAGSARQAGQGSNSALDKLNSRLNGLLPSGDPVAYSDKHYENDLGAAVAEAEEQYYKAAAPPPAVLAKVIDVVKQRGSLLGPPTILYILKRQRIFGIEICTGWQIEQTPTGPQGGYTFGACSGEKFSPSGGLPAPPPKPRASPE